MDLEITAGADISNLTKGMADAQKSLAQTALAAGKLDSSLKRGTVGINQAGNALQNLGRVAQDAPYGFIGIQNNLNPLLESFQRLKTETGSAGSALKALGSSLLGAGGIGLALSVVSSLLVAFPGLLSSMTDAELKAIKAQKEYNDELSKGAASAQTEVTSLKALLFVAQDNAQSTQTRKEALKELQKEYPGYLKNIDLESINSKAATDAINDLTGAIGRKARAQALSNLLTKENEKLFNLEKSSLADNIGYLDAITSNFFGLGSTANTAARLVVKGEKLKQASLIDTKHTINVLTAELEGLTAEQAKGLDFTKFTKGKEKAVKDIETIAEVLAKLQHQISVASGLEELFNIDKSKEKIGDITSAITHLLDKFNASGERNAAIIKLKFAIDELTPDVLSKGGIANILKESTTIPLSLLPPKPSQLNSTIKKTTVLLKDGLAEMTGLLQNTFADITSTLGESLGKAFSGGGNFLKEALGGVFNIMGDFLIQLGKAAVLTSKLFIAIKASKANPISGIIGGIAAIAAGFILKNIKLPGFAEGGYIRGAGSSTSDSILARLSKGEFVIKANTVAKFGSSFFDMINKGYLPPKFASGGIIGSDSIGGGQNINVSVYGKLQGRDIVISGQRATSTISRNG